jgi:subtilisin
MKYRALQLILALGLTVDIASAQTTDPETRPIGKRADPAQFAAVIDHLSDRANSRSDGRVRVMVELALAANEHVDVHERTRSARAEERYRASVSRRQDAIAQALGSRFARGEQGYINRVDGLPFVSVFVTPSELRTLAVIPYVASVAEEGQLVEFLQDTVPQVEADALQASGHSGIYRTVAVIDSGVQTDHPFYSARLVGGACYSTSDPGYGPICAGGAASGSTTVASGGPCSHGETIGGPAGDCRHGTHVAGIAVGNASTRKGVAPAANLVSIQVGSQTANGCAPGYMVPCRRNLESDVVNALNRVYAIRNNYSIASVNLSLGITIGGFSSLECSGSWPALATAIGQLEAAHIPVVVASGNFARVQPTNANRLPVPACIAKTLSVAGVRKNDTFGTYSNANQGLLDMLAPGVTTTEPAKWIPLSSAVPMVPLPERRRPLRT